MDRVLALPRTVTPDVADLSAWLRPGQSPIALRPVQQQALRALAENGGLLGGIGVGHGKSYIALLAGLVVQADVSIVLVAPATIQTMRDLLKVCEEKYFLPTTHILSWGRLSATDGGDVLEELVRGHKSICVVADEAHCARNATAARTKRLMRFLQAHADATFVAMSGTLTTKRVKDFAHLSRRALGDQSPVPTGEHLRCWDEVLADDYKSPADVASIKPLWAWAECTRDRPFPKVGLKLPAGMQARLAEAFGERLQTAPGVVLTQDVSCPASLYIAQIQSINVPELRTLWVQAEQIAETYKDPEGLELTDDAEVARTAKRLSLGYYLQWKWPGDVVNREWLDARRRWARLCRDVLGKGHFDTEFAFSRFINLNPDKCSDVWLAIWQNWCEVRKSDNVPMSLPTWVTREPLRYLVQKAQQESPCLLWYDEEAVADALQELGVHVIRATRPVPSVKDAPVVALSLRSHGTGLNLQDWSRQVFACVPAGGTIWEQALGRTHRAGQQADEVWTWVPAWSGPLRAGLRTARQDAEWIERSMGNRQRLNLATYVED